MVSLKGLFLFVFACTPPLVFSQQLIISWDVVFLLLRASMQVLQNHSFNLYLIAPMKLHWNNSRFST